MFNTRITVTAIAVLIGFHPASATAAGSGRQRAILVGVNEYDHAKLKPLRYSVSDVTALAPLLRQAGYEIDLLTDDEGRKGPVVGQRWRTSGLAWRPSSRRASAPTRS